MMNMDSLSYLFLVNLYKALNCLLRNLYVNKNMLLKEPTLIIVNTRMEKIEHENPQLNSCSPPLNRKNLSLLNFLFKVFCKVIIRVRACK